MHAFFRQNNLYRKFSLHHIFQSRLFQMRYINSYRLDLTQILKVLKTIRQYRLYIIYCVMDNDILIQKLKLGNILLQQIKYGITIIFLFLLCHPSEQFHYRSIIFYATIITVSFNILSHIYLQFIRRDFPRIEYFLIYTFNIFLFLAQLIYSFQSMLHIPQQKTPELIFTRSIIFLLLQKELEILIIMIFPFEIGNRQVNNCSTSLTVFLIYSSNDQIACYQQEYLILLMLSLINLLGLIFCVLFNLLLFKYSQLKRELRNFINITTILFSISSMVCYVQSFTFKNEGCPYIQLILVIYQFIAPISFFSIGFVIVQELLSTKEMNDKEQLIAQNPYLKGNQQNSLFFHVNYNKQINFVNNNLQSKKLNSLRSQQSRVLASQVQNESNNNIQAIKSDEVKEQSNPKILEKKGTGQFGSSQHQFVGGMLHSWANVQNANPFFGEAESQIAVPVDKNVNKEQGEQKSQSRSGKQPSSYEESIQRQGDESFHIANPMESGSNLTVH